MKSDTGKHYSRIPAAELPVERSSDGAILCAKVQFVDQDQEPEYRDTPTGRVRIINVDRGNFLLVINVLGKDYSATGGWGLEALSEVVQAMARDKYWPRCCFNCYYFKQAGMYEEWSLGTQGYCTLCGTIGVDHLTHIMHVCQKWLRSERLIESRSGFQLADLYHKALAAVSDRPETMEDVKRARSLRPSSVTSNDFIREYAWVVFVVKHHEL